MPVHSLDRAASHRVHAPAAGQPGLAGRV